MNRFRDDGPPGKKFRSNRDDYNNQGNRQENRGRDERFNSSGNAYPKTFMEKNPDIERHNAPPSRVLHVRGLREFATENDIVDAIKQFGRVSYVMMIPRNRQALVEFENVEDAKRVVEFSETNSIYVCGQVAFFNFSTSDSIKRPEGMGGNDGPSSDNKILLFTILNPKYPITVDVMHTICSPHGEVLRIVVSKKQGVQAMVEFDNTDSARKAKQALNGCDVYSGCCTLKIDYARPDIQRLNVVKNDKETFDYTNPNPGAGRGALLGDGPAGGGSQGFGGGGWDDGNQGSNNYTEPAFFNEPNQSFNRGNGMGGMNNDGGNFNGPNFGNGSGNFNDGFARGGGRGGMGGGRGGRGRGGDMGRGGFGGRGGFQGGRGGGNMGGPGPMNMQGGPGNNEGPQPGSVLLVYGLAVGKFNCDKLFNIFCIYGNVCRIKMLRSKEGGAMVNMQDHASCERAVMNLNNSYFFNSKLSVSFSKQDFVVIHPNPNQLEDGTPSAKDFSNNKNNRFFSPDSIHKTRFSPPTKVIHFFNAPPSAKEEDLKRVFVESGTALPARIRIFPVKPQARSAAGLVEFEGVAEASEALVAANHFVIPNPDGKMPFSLKLSFSASPIIDKPGRGNEEHIEDD